MLMDTLLRLERLLLLEKKLKAKRQTLSKLSIFALMLLFAWSSLEVLYSSPSHIRCVLTSILSSFFLENNVKFTETIGAIAKEFGLIPVEGSLSIIITITNLSYLLILSLL